MLRHRTVFKKGIKDMFLFGISNVTPQWTNQKIHLIVLG